jgi:dihydroxyacetone kinase phosphotransfer subunit
MIGLLVVSHSRDAAKGITEIASQMCGGKVPLRGVGGSDDGGLGTSVPHILEALKELLEEVKEVLILPDLGSAVLSARAALEFLEDGADRITFADAPILEGAMMAAVEASIGSPLSRVRQAAEEAHLLKKLGEEAP